MDVVHHNACAFNRHSQPLLLLERALGILVAALPMLAHGGARKFIILGMPLICFLLVDQLQYRDLREGCELLSQPALVVRQPVIGDFPQRGVKAGLPRMDPSIDVGVVARARGIHDVLVPRHHILDVPQKDAARAEKVDLKMSVLSGSSWSRMYCSGVLE